MIPYLPLLIFCFVVNILSAQESYFHKGKSNVYEPGFFHWNENTVIKMKDISALHILRCQEILDHSNTDFSDHPGSMIILEIDSSAIENVDHKSYIIAISQDSIQVTAPSVKSMEKALVQLHKMKIEAESNSPDYGLIYLRRGIYLTNNF